MLGSCTPLDLTRTAFKTQDTQCSRCKQVTLEHCCSANFHVQLVVSSGKVVSLSKVLLLQLGQVNHALPPPWKKQPSDVLQSVPCVQAFNTGSMAKPDHHTRHCFLWDQVSPCMSQLAWFFQHASSNLFFYIKPRPFLLAMILHSHCYYCSHNCVSEWYHLPSTETSRDLTRSLLLPTRIIGMSSVCLALLSWILSSEAFSKLTLSVTEYTII